MNTTAQPSAVPQKQLPALLRLQQNAIALLLLIAVYLLVMYATPAVKYEPHGIVFAFQKKAPTDKNTVELFNTLPMQATVIGNLRAELSNNTGGTGEQQMETLVNYARDLAASIGGNGIIIAGEGGSERVTMIEAFVLID